VDRAVVVDQTVKAAELPVHKVSQNGGISWFAYFKSGSEISERMLYLPRVCIQNNHYIVTVIALNLSMLPSNTIYSPFAVKRCSASGIGK
jgi:hypothetical protein